MSEKLKLAEKTALDIDRLRDGYRPAARRGAILFFVLSEMALVNAMYQYSLSAFLEVFGLSLKKSLPDSILIKRLRNITDTLTFNIYNYGCTGERPLARTGTGVRCVHLRCLHPTVRWDWGPLTASLPLPSSAEALSPAAAPFWGAGLRASP